MGTYHNGGKGAGDRSGTPWIAWRMLPGGPPATSSMRSRARRAHLCGLRPGASSSRGAPKTGAGVAAGSGTPLKNFGVHGLQTEYLSRFRTTGDEEGDRGGGGMMARGDGGGIRAGSRRASCRREPARIRAMASSALSC